MLEIDTPGHTSIIHNSHPEFVACFEAKPWTSYANGTTFVTPYVSDTLLTLCRAPSWPAATHGATGDRFHEENDWSGH
jgi:hexosaminidase